MKPSTLEQLSLKLMRHAAELIELFQWGLNVESTQKINSILDRIDALSNEMRQALGEPDQAS
jgi:hypothetical protein